MADFASPSGTPSATPLPTVAVHVHGIVRGREIDAPGQASLDEGALLLQWPAAAAWRLALDGLEGIAVHAQRCTLYLRDHDVLELSGGDDLRPLALSVLAAACRMPELTRGLRAFGLTRVPATGPDDPLAAAHDAWFAPLLDARRAVQGVSDPLRQVSLLDGAKLTAAMQRVLTDLSRTLAGKPAEQRALEAVMEDEAAPLFEALARMTVAGEALRGSAMDSQLAEWRRWVEQARAVFAAADEAWAEISVVLRG
jgi:hypothetical protein